MKIRHFSKLRVAACFLLGAMLASCGGGEEGSARPKAALHIVAGSGSFAYFQLMWPQVEVAQANAATAAVIEPAASGHLFAATANGNREWLATTYAPWIDRKGEPYKGMEITAFLSGVNETHTSQPTSNRILSSGSSNIAGIALYQSQRAAYKVPLVQAGTAYIGVAPGAPAISTAVDAAAMINLYQTAATVDLTPTAAEEAQFQIAADAALADFGRRLIIAAKALRDGHSGTIVISMPGLDPHGAFADLPVLQARLRVIQAQLNGFYDLLESRFRDDEVLITISGDTPKNPLARNGWPDGTPSNSNWIYVVGKGHLKQGWFGRVHANGEVSSYNPATGLDDAVASSGTRQIFTAAAIAYAGTSGDAAFVKDVLMAGDVTTYQGVVR